MYFKAREHSNLIFSMYKKKAARKGPPYLLPTFVQPSSFPSTHSPRMHGSLTLVSVYLDLGNSKVKIPEKTLVFTEFTNTLYDCHRKWRQSWEGEGRYQWVCGEGWGHLAWTCGSAWGHNKRKTQQPQGTWAA